MNRVSLASILAFGNSPVNEILAGSLARWLPTNRELHRPTLTPLHCEVLGLVSSTVGWPGYLS